MDIKITLETLYDILRNEKKREDLQEVDPAFFVDVVSYVREKKVLLEQSKTDDNVFAATEKDKISYELRSIKRILKEIYEKREQKIIAVALNRSKTGSDIIDTGCMLREEKDFYAQILQVLDTFRRGVLFKVINAKLPDLTSSRIDISASLPKPAVDQKLDFESKKEHHTKETKEVESKEDEGKENAKEKEIDTTKVRIIHPMPSFVWKDMKVYGPYNIGDEIDIFAEVANLLVRKGRAKIV